MHSFFVVSRENQYFKVRKFRFEDFCRLEPLSSGQTGVVLEMANDVYRNLRKKAWKLSPDMIQNLLSFGMTAKFCKSDKSSTIVAVKCP